MTEKREKIQNRLTLKSGRVITGHAIGSDRDFVDVFWAEEESGISIEIRARIPLEAVSLIEEIASRP